MIIVHHLNNSRSQRILWMLEELGLPYEIKFYQRDPKTMLAPPELKLVHPLGKSPVLVDDGVGQGSVGAVNAGVAGGVTAGVTANSTHTVAESGAIIEYLLRRYGGGRLAPKADSLDYTKMIYWLHYAEGSLMPPLLLTLVFSTIPKQPMPFFARPFAEKISEQVLKGYVTPQVRSHIHFCEEELGKSEWFAGAEMSAADIQMSFPLEAARARGAIDARHPRLLKFLDRIQSRPAYKKALERGGPYDLLS